MLYVNSPAVQARVDAYVRKPSLAPLPLAGEASGEQIARLAPYARTGVCRIPLANLAIRELSTTNPED